MFRLLVVFAGGLLLAGCTSLPGNGTSSDLVIAQPSSASRSERADGIYKVLVAEFAGQRGDLALAVRNYLDVARATRQPEIAERALRVAVYARDDEAARQAASLWVELKPENQEAHRVLAALHLRANDIEAAVAEFNRVVSDLQGAGHQRYAVVAETLIRERKRDTAKAVMARFMETRMDDRAAVLVYAKFAVRVGDNELAGELLDKILEARPDFKAALLLKAQTLQSRKRIGEALEIIEQVLEDHPDDIETRTAYARLLVNAKRYDDALNEFRSLSERAPDNNDVRFALALLLLEAQRLDEARNEFESLLGERERALTAHYYLGQIAETQDRVNDARQHYLQVTSGQHRIDAQIRVAVLLAEQGRVDDARAHLHSIMTQDSKASVRLYMVEAEILSDAGLGGEAMATYDRGLEEFEGNAELLYARAMQGERNGRIDILERDLRAILAEDPKNAQALNALGYTLADQTERYDEALEFITRALELRPEDHFILDSMGWVLYRLGRMDEALDYLRRATAKSNDPEIAAHLGEVLWVTGDQAGARSVWEEALRSTPDDQNLQDVMRRFLP